MSYKFLFHTALLAAALLMTGCTVREAPAPVVMPEEPPASDGSRAAPSIPAASVTDPIDPPTRIPQGGRGTVTSAAEQGRSAAAQSLLVEAIRAATLGDWARAQAQLERAVRIEPRDAALWRQLAYTRLKQGEVEAAEQLAQRARDLSVDRDSIDESEALLSDIRAARAGVRPAADHGR